MRPEADRHVEGFGFLSAPRDSSCKDRATTDDASQRAADTGDSDRKSNVLLDLHDRERDDALGAVARYNRCVLDRHHTDERQFYCSKSHPCDVPGRPERLHPALGIALSGGGMRSASFAIGLLSGLNETGALDELEVLSSVSGGSYALSWLYAQPFYMDRRGCTDGRHPWDRLLTPGSAFQNKLAQNGGLVSVWRGLGFGVANLLASPVNLVANGVFGWRWNTTPARPFYESRIEHVYNRVPTQECADLPSPQSTRNKALRIADPIYLDELGDFAKRENLPFFVINTTAAIDDDQSHHGSRLSNSVFELTPISIGSNGLGYFPREFSPGSSDDTNLWRPALSESVATSGAALDGSVISGASQQTLWSFFNQDTGLAIDNYNPEISATQRILHRIKPFPLYFDDDYHYDANGHRLYLSDGGHADNLGVFSLVRRLPKKILIVDAEHDAVPCTESDNGTDPQNRVGLSRYCAKFEGYKKVRAALRREMGVQLSVPAIDNDTHRPYRMPTASFPGSICAFPLHVAGPEPEHRCIDVRYVKLSINGAAIEAGQSPYPASVSRYYEKRKDSRCGALGGLLGKCPFPQQSTSDQSFSTEQFCAYRDLGRTIACKEFTDWPKSGKGCSNRVREGDVCQQ